MKRIIIILIPFFLFGCSKSIEVNGNKYLVKSGTDYILEDNIYKFYPKEESTYLFGEFKAILDSNFKHSINSEGIILEGKLGANLEVKNSQATVIIPNGSEFEFNSEYEYYYFVLKEVTGAVKTEYVNFKINKYVLLTEDLSFKTNIGETIDFDWKGEKIIFLRNDSPPWINNEDFDYNYFSQKYRNRIEYDFLKDVETFDVGFFESILEPPEHAGPGVHTFMGASYELVIDPQERNIVVAEITNEEDIIRCFEAMKVSNPIIDTYEHKLILPLKVKQFGKVLDGNFEFIIPHQELRNIRNILSNGEILNLTVRLGNFNDFTTLGYGIIYSSHNNKQRAELMASFDE